jgi:small subunit ribosomal protein S18
MAKAKAQKRGKNKDNSRRSKKKVSVLQTEKIEYVDWKDTTLLRRFMSERAKIRARRVTGNSQQQQKLVADAIKVAREMALVPYTNRVTTQRSNKSDRDRQGRAEGPLPRPSAPPPPPRADGSDADAASDAKPDDSPPVDMSEAPSAASGTVGDDAGETGSAEATEVSSS